MNIIKYNNSNNDKEFIEEFRCEYKNLYKLPQNMLNYINLHQFIVIYIQANFLT